MSEPIDFSALKTKYGDLVIIDIADKTLAFKRLTKSQLTDMRKRINSKPELAIEISINCCEFNCVFGAEHFKEMSDRFPLAFCGNDDSKGVIDALLDLARGGASGPQIRVE
jgi:hypothetical protein